ncbi:porin family protein [Haliscomenobacter hydrossis]|uniref:Outer membrane protein beta-barrel domain-containing protein n=1 Tax=Haliscomenobacter hydrossis (strain ATCC 27775 / DSM 1100 / LMG 10767 / O) TaxID=760192 RepID=F4L0R4_HALH1|nr:porin family protein [Haliscomenobacter hydrossis]AEE49546.1 hypothetical protein Halhy_1657 [Haliscomenobacter hydrossis DSM 1100]
MSNRIALTSLCLLIGLTVIAQNGSKWEFGVKAGLNYTGQHASGFPEFLGQDLNKIYNKTTTWDPGLSAGFQSKLRLSENFSLNADLLYNQRAYTSTTKDTSFSEVKLINRLHYLSLPVYGGLQLLPGLNVEIGVETSYFLDWTGKYQGNQIEPINRDAISDFDFGVAGGLSYRINKYLSLQGRYYRGLVNTMEVKFTDINGNELEGNTKFINHGVQLSLTVFPF